MGNSIRNFCIISHVDHGKSTLADRFLELTGTIEKRKMKEQFLDQMELEREKGITIKMQPVRMLWHPHRRQYADKTQTIAEDPFLYKDLTYKIRGILFEVRKKLGLGHKEQVYHSALEIEFRNAGIQFESKKNIAIRYGGSLIGTYQPDFIVENKVLIELKALPEIGRPQIEQVWSYLKGCDYKLALLVNYGSKDVEIKRIVYDIARAQGSALSALGLRQSAGAEDQTEDEYILNLIDTPGHADFSYEVSRSLAAVEGAILLVDATKGVQAQTLAHLNHAKKQGLAIIPCVNKIDSPLARTEEVAREIVKLLSIAQEKIFRISAKEGIGVEEVLQAVIDIVPAPRGEESKPFRALIFDSRFDTFKGIVAFVRVVDGSLLPREKILLLGTNVESLVKEVGSFSPAETVQACLRAGEIGYIATGIKETEKVRIGDTITKFEIRNTKSETLVLPGFEIPKPVVFVSLYPQNPNEFDALKDALSKLKLNDPSLSYEVEAKEALGRGFRCGFLGVLHSEIISERIEREYKIQMVISRPSVEFSIVANNGKVLSVKVPSDWPAPNMVKSMEESWAEVEVITPGSFLSATLQFLRGFEGSKSEVEDLGEEKFLLRYEMPLRELIGDFHDRLKSVTQGMASMDYRILGMRPADLVKLEFRIAGVIEEALSMVVPEARAYQEGKKIVEKLKEVLPPQLFEVALQAMVGARVLARETISARRKDVTAPLYGGDVTRKKKLLEIQKKGKKELKAKGRVVIPTRVFLDLFRT